MIEQFNHIAGLWWSGAIAMFWQVGVLIILIGCVDLIIRKWAWPQLSPTFSLKGVKGGL